MDGREMIKALRARMREGNGTVAFPDGPAPSLPARFRGRPEITARRCADGCSACADACPTAAISLQPRLAVDLGRCLFCAECASACPSGALAYGGDYRLAARRRSDLLVGEGGEQDGVRLAAALDASARRLFGRSLKLRQGSAGGCDACESEINVLRHLVWDLSA